MEFVTAGQGIGRRFQVVTVLPTFILVAGIWFIVATGGWTGSPTLGSALDSLSGLTITGAAFVILGVIALALALHPMQLKLVKAMEGYLSPSNPLIRYGLARHARIVHYHRSRGRHLERKEYELAERFFEDDPEVELSALSSIRHKLTQLERVTTSYPHRDRLMPTLLGNRLRAAEDLAGDRYGIAVVSFMPYLYALMPSDSTARIQDARNAMDTSVRLTIVFLSLCVVAFVVFANDSWWLSLPIALYLVSWVSYRAAVDAATGYGKMLGRAVDLYRFSVLDAMSWQRPATVNEERTKFAELRQFLIDPIGKEDGSQRRYCHQGPRP